MNIKDTLLECEGCHQMTKESNTLSCQHSFCSICLKDDGKDADALKCPTCSAKFEESVRDGKNDLYLNLSACSICEKNESGWFCLDCDQSLCFACSENHNKFKLFKNHNIIQSKDEGLKTHLSDRFYCVDCKQIFELEFLDSHDKHKVKKEIECIRETVNAWKHEIKDMNAYEVTVNNQLISDGEKWTDKKKEALKNKDQVKDNYQELMEALKSKEALEYYKIDADILRMEKEYLERQQLFEKDILSIQKARSKIESKLEEIKNGLPKGFTDELPYEVPQMHPHLHLEHHLSFQPIPKDVVSKLQSCIMEIVINCTGIYVAEKQRILKTTYTQIFRQLDEQYIYADDGKEEKIYMYSIKTLKLIKIIKCPKGFNSYSNSYLLNFKEYVYVIGYVEGMMFFYNEKGDMLDQFMVPSQEIRLARGENLNVLITTSKNILFSYDLKNKELELIPVPLGIIRIYGCWSMGDGEYCMEVVIKGKNEGKKIIKVVNENIEKVLDISNDIEIHTNGSGLVCIVENKKSLRLFDKNFDPISVIELNLHGNLKNVHMDCNFNIHALSQADPFVVYYMKKYKMKPKCIN